MIRVANLRLGVIPLLVNFWACTSNTEIKNPNVIIFLTDDQGWGDLSVSGNNNLETPNIDRLAKTGVSFSHFYVSPVCSPTRAELLTGRYHPRSGVYSTSSGGERMDLDEKTIAEYFKNAGYSTALYGKWHNGMQASYHPNARGFDDFYGFCSGHWGNYFSPMLEHNGEIVNGNGYLIDDFTDKGIEFIERHKEKPFFLILPYNSPHSPMQVPDRWWEKFKDKELKMRHYNIQEEDIQFTRAALAMCENIDWNVGRVISKIESLGLNETTIFVFLSDNGPNSWRWNNGKKGRKGSTDEGGVHSPLFIKWDSNLQESRIVNHIAGAIDILPTLLDLAGIDFEPQNPLDGLSLKALMTHDLIDWNERLLFSHWGGKTSVRNQRFRLDNEGKLFNIETDASQRIDVSNDFPDISMELNRAKIDWENEVLSELCQPDMRPFQIGHPKIKFTHLPARDGIPYGNIIRSNKFPNDSYFTNWISLSDSISWDIEVVEDGNYSVDIFYTCPNADVGSTIELGFALEKISSQVVTAYDPPLQGSENDRIERIESYTKSFIPMTLGTINLSKGKGKLTLKATNIVNNQVMDFRLLVLKYLD